MATETWAHQAGLRPGCFAVLRVVIHGPTAQRDLASGAGLDPSVVVDLVDRLERAGYVERRRDPDDRRRQLVTITATGRRATKRFAAVSERASAGLTAGLSPTERAELHRLIERVLAGAADEP